MTFYVLNRSDEKFFLKYLEVGEVPTSEKGVTLGPVTAIIQDANSPIKKSVFLQGYTACYCVYSS